jgi:late p6Gag/p9Gag-like protein
MKELNASFNTLLQDKRVRSEQSKYEAIQRQRASAINRYKRAYQEFLEMQAGLQGAKRWYAEMKDTVASLEKNVESFVNNRRTEGAQLLNQIEQEKSTRKDSQAEAERERLRGLMERMSVDPGHPPPKPPSARPTPTPLNFTSTNSSGSVPRYPQANYQTQYQTPQSPPPTQTNMPQYPGFGQPSSSQSYGAAQPANSSFAYNPSQYGRNPGPTSPPPHQSSFGPAVHRGPASPPPTQLSFSQNHQYGGYPNPQQQQQQQQQQHGHAHSMSQGFIPAGFVPPPPPPGPPPLGPQQTFYGGEQPQQQHQGHQQHPQGGYAQGGYPHSAHPQSAQGNPGDPWAGLNAWK